MEKIAVLFSLLLCFLLLFRFVCFCIFIFGSSFGCFFGPQPVFSYMVPDSWTPPCGRMMSQWVRGRRQTDLLCEATCPQEESQKTPYDHGQHRHDEQSILFAHVLHPHPHCIQSHGHHESPVLRPVSHVLPATHKCRQPKAFKSRWEDETEAKKSEQKEAAPALGWDVV